MARRAPGDNVFNTRPVPNGRHPSGFWLVPENFLPNQKAERGQPFGTSLIRHCPQWLFSPFFTFLCAILSRLFRLSLAPTICPWVSKDGHAWEPKTHIPGGHFWVPKTLTPKMRPSAQPFLLKLSFISVRIKNHFQTKAWALNHVLIQRPEGTQKLMAY